MTFSSVPPFDVDSHRVETTRCCVERALLLSCRLEACLRDRPYRDAAHEYFEPPETAPDCLLSFEKPIS